MEKKILILAAKMLEMSSQSFSNNGCNDLPSEVIEMSDDNLCKEISEWLGEDDYPSNLNQVQDWMLMDFLKDKFIEAAK